MQLLNPSLVALLTILAVVPSTLSSPSSVVVEVDTYDNDKYPGKPAHPLFACVIKSRNCQSPSIFTDLSFEPNVNLGICHHDGFFKNMFNRLSPSKNRGFFFNTVYVSCPERDAECLRKVEGRRPEEVRDGLERGIEEQTSCDAWIKCYTMDEVDEQCFPKND